MLGSSLPFPAGLISISFSSTISSVISTLPCKKMNRLKHYPGTKRENIFECFWTFLKNHAEDMNKHTPRSCFPSFSIAHGHQPRTDFWEKRELDSIFLEEADPIIPGSIFKLHFSGVLAGGMRLSRSSSTEPVTEIWQINTTAYLSFKAFLLSGHGINCKK